MWGPHTDVTLEQDTGCKHELEVLSCWSCDSQGWLASKGMGDVGTSSGSTAGQGVDPSQGDAVGAIKLLWGP